jgi:hypothetical protein
MGSLVSKPKTPAPARIQFVNMPATSTAESTNTTGTASTVASDTSTSGQTDNGAADGLSDKETSTLRAENIARRSRGRSGTVKTGFNGLLAINQITPSRKSLLGE